MNARIYQYPLAWRFEQAVSIPDGAHVLSVAPVGPVLCLFALVPSIACVPVARRVFLIRSGDEFTFCHPVDLSGGEFAPFPRFVGSAEHGNFIYHVFIREGIA